MQALSRRRDDLRRLAAGEKTRLATPGLSDAVRTSLARVVAILAKEAGRLQARADAVVAADEHLSASRELLRTVPGVGPVAASAVLAQLPDPARALPPRSRRPPTPARLPASTGPGRASRSAPGCPRRATPGSARNSTSPR